MATNLRLDYSLVRRAVTLGRHRNKKDAVTRALREYVQKLEDEKMLSVFGKADFGPGYDCTQQRGGSRLRCNE